MIINKTNLKTYNDVKNNFVVSNEDNDILARVFEELGIAIVGDQVFHFKNEKENTLYSCRVIAVYDNAIVIKWINGKERHIHYV